MNKWKKAFMVGFPVLPTPALLMNLALTHPERALWAKISMEAELRQEDLGELIPQLLQEALGKRALEKARSEIRGGRQHARDVDFICYRAAMMACHCLEPKRAPTVLRITGLVRQLLLTQTEREEDSQNRRWKTFLRTAEPYNRLPC